MIARQVFRIVRSVQLGIRDVVRSRPDQARQERAFLNKMSLAFLTSVFGATRRGLLQLRGGAATCARQSVRRARAPSRMAATGAGDGGGVRVTGGASTVSGPTMVRARHILVDSEAMVDALQTQVLEGADFAGLASSMSTCPSKERGGDLGWFKRHMMVPAFEAAAFDNPPGSLLKVNTEFGWHLLRVDEHGVAAGNIRVTELAARFPDGLVDAPGVQLIDCRERNELERAKVDGFLNLPMGEYGTWADKFEKGELGLDKDVETIVMCHHGMRSANFCTFLSQQGFLNVRNLLGGIDAYSKEVDESIPTY